jgi:hypothetical protein
MEYHPRQFDCLRVFFFCKFKNMNITELSRQDFNNFVSDNDNGFGQSVTLTAPNATTLVMVAYCNGHQNSFDTDGNPINAQNVTVTLPERTLDENSYPYLNGENEVDLTGHNATIPSAVGSPITYRIEQWHHDQEIGAIVCILGYYQNI